MKRTLLIVLLSIFAIASFSNGLPAKIFSREYYYRASEADSEITARSIVLNQVKTVLLEEIGVYIGSTFDDTAKENNSVLEQLSQQQIVSITAGVTETKIIDEKWDGKTYYIKAEITVDIDDVKKKISEIAKDKDKTIELEEVKEKADEAFKQIEILQVKLSKTGDEKEKLKLQADYQKRSNELSAADWFQMGYNASGSNEYDKAILYYQKAISINPEYAYAYSGIGFVYFSEGNYDKTIEMYRKAINLNSGNAKAYVYMGLCYDHKGNYDQAITLYEKAIRINPENAGIYYSLGSAYEKNGEHERAIEYLKKAAQLGDDNAKKVLKDSGI